MASPFDFRAPHHAPPHLLPAEWSDTDQHIIESLLLPAADLSLKRVGRFAEADGRESKGLAVAQPVSRTTLTGSGRSGREAPPAKKTRASRKRVTVEEKRMKHREVQRRFMQRKKESIAQVKKSITALETQLELVKLSTEAATLESENSALLEQVQVRDASAAQRPAQPQDQPPAQGSLLDQFMREIPQVERIFRPLSPERWEEIVCRTLEDIDTVFSSCSLKPTGFSVLGWTDHRCVEDSTVTFTLSKTFPHLCAEELWSRTWDRISTDSYASFFSPALLVRKHLLQRVCSDAIIVYRCICYPQTGRISRAVEIISRVRRANDFVFFIRSLDTAEVKQELDASDAWTQSLTALRFSPADPAHPAAGCTVHYGGSYQNIPKGGVRYWLMEILFLVLRFESSLISPAFALCDA